MIDNNGTWAKIEGRQWFGSNIFKSCTKTSLSKRLVIKFHHHLFRYDSVADLYLDSIRSVNDGSARLQLDLKVKYKLIIYSITSEILREICRMCQSSLEPVGSGSKTFGQDELQLEVKLSVTLPEGCIRRASTDTDQRKRRNSYLPSDYRVQIEK